MCSLLALRVPSSLGNEMVPQVGETVVNGSVASEGSPHVATNQGPVAYFSLEMSPTEITYRWLAAQARIDSILLRTGLTNNGGGGGAGADTTQIWTKLVEATNRLYQVPLHADDRSRTVGDIRAKSRRLKRSACLALVVVDYMQLMHTQGRSRENRQQEIAEISRNLKALARELDVPVVAVSQLNRALEARQDKRPQLGDLR